MVFDDGYIAGLARIVEALDQEELLLFTLMKAGKKRRVKWQYKRLNWEEHVQMCEHTNGFEARYHMSLESFNKLVDLLRPIVTLDELQSMRSTGGCDPITPELTVACGLRFLGGEKVISVADCIGASLSTVRRVTDNFLRAVDHTIRIPIPWTDEEFRKCADDWSDLSSAFGVYDGVIGAIDGWLACIEKPNVPHPLDYYSGHYMRYGLNIQAICDAHLRFIYFGVIAPGKTHDAKVFSRCEGLQYWLRNVVPEEYFLVGDNAYPLSNKLLIPFSGEQKNEGYRRSYNYFLSQQRIRIEMAFGRLTTKWRIFRRNLESKTVEKNSLIIRVAGKLHNFVIDNDNLNFSGILINGESINEAAEVMEVEPFLDNEFGADVSETENFGYLPILPVRRSGGVATQQVIDRVSSRRRDAIVAELRGRAMRRPQHNIDRNGDDESVYEELWDDAEE